MSHNKQAVTRSQFRTLIRSRRNGLTPEQQQSDSNLLLEQLKSLPEINQARKIAIYLTNDGEIDTTPIIQWLWQAGIEVFLPVIHPFSKGHLLFLAYDETTPLVKNQYQIDEPRLDATKIIPVANLDIMFTPLVGFDNLGHRIGMGGGYYDRTLAPWFDQHIGPIPVGLAHNCQHVEKLPIEDWDVPLPLIVTPSKIWRWENSHKSL